MLPEVREKLLFTGAFLLVLGLGFFAGRLSGRVEHAETSEPIRQVSDISTAVPTINFTAADKGLLYGSSNGKELRIFVQDQIVEHKPDGSFFIDTGSIKQVALTGNNNSGGANEKYLFVASKNSSLYHPVGSSTANRIKAENKVYFLSREEAESKGFSPGSDVK